MGGGGTHHRHQGGMSGRVGRRKPWYAPTEWSK